MFNSANVGIIYNPSNAKTSDIVKQLMSTLGMDGSAWVISTSELTTVAPPPSMSLIITVGGDGTILAAAQIAAPMGIPILGVNLGRIGFMTELSANEASDKIYNYLSGDVRIETRSMLQASLYDNDIVQSGGVYQALNDIVVGRSWISRPVHLQVSVDGSVVTTYRSDAVIVATATGSTGYSISVGGPILDPESRNILVNPVAPHMGLSSTLILQENSRVDITVKSDLKAVMSVDGRTDLDVNNGQTVSISRSPHTARFLRANPTHHFYSVLTDRLNPGT